jgi:hypothetical protein
VNLYILDEEGNPVITEDVLEWGRMMDDPARIVAQDTMGEYYISTVFIGVDTLSDFWGVDPLLWETAVWKGNTVKRYSSKEAAIDGHIDLVVWATMQEDDDGEETPAEEAEADEQQEA